MPCKAENPSKCKRVFVRGWRAQDSPLPFSMFWLIKNKCKDNKPKGTRSLQMAEKTPNIPQKSGIGNIWIKEYILVWRPTWNLSNIYLKTDHMIYLIDLVCGAGSKSMFPNNCGPGSRKELFSWTMQRLLKPWLLSDIGFVQSAYSYSNGEESIR